MATNNSVNVGLSGSTGTGNFVGSNSPTLITPTLGAATATSIAYSPTTNGAIGTAAANNASAGTVGEYVTSNVAAGSGVSVTNGSAADITSISLTAGDWDVYGNITVNNAASALTGFHGWCSTTSATEPNQSLVSKIGTSATASVSGPVPLMRLSISSTTTTYLSVVPAFSSGTATAGGSIYARRRR